MMGKKNKAHARAIEIFQTDFALRVCLILVFSFCSCVFFLTDLNDLGNGTRKCESKGRRFPRRRRLEERR